MINTSFNIHDRFTVEFKIGFVTSRKEENIQKFKINTWLFLPNSLDVNKHTYTKEQFYSDIQSNVRIITPIYSIAEILQEGHGPFFRLEKAIDRFIQEPTKEHAESYLYQTKMLLCIVRSTLRKGFAGLTKLHNGIDFIKVLSNYIESISLVCDRYRRMRDRIGKSPYFTDEQKEYFLFGDEYLGNIVEENVFAFLNRFKKNASSDEIKKIVIPLIAAEQKNKEAMGYSLPSEDKESNSLLLIKRNVLKKFIESDLYLQRIKKADGVFARELYYGLAAGLAMIFATIVSFVATQRFGNFTSSLFFALVIAYIFKDRIKDSARQYFSSRLDQKYFDWKWNVSLRNQKIGWIREAFDFISQDQVPEIIHNHRNRSTLMKAENEVYDEKVILYRKRVDLSRKDLEEYKDYRLVGINNIIGINLTSFVKKMDNPEMPIYLPDETEGYRTIAGNRVYALHFVLECQSDDDLYYKTYRLLLNRNGISDISEIEPA